MKIQTGSEVVFHFSIKLTDGSVAAPTAGLHFTESVLDSLSTRGIKSRNLTLHVGAGTFVPVKTSTIGGHNMHREYFSIDRDCIEAFYNTRVSR